MKLLIEWMEKGILPDFLIRVGIRHLNRKTLCREQRGDIEQRLARKKDLFQFLRINPVAVETDKANLQHYELPAEFFEYIMGPNLKYSCCVWQPDIRTIDQAEGIALSMTVKRAEITDGMRILDLGCGWGSLSGWIAKHFPNCKITAVSNSRIQKNFIEKRCLQNNIKNIEVITADANVFVPQSRFDRIVSIEMFEHMRNYQALMKKTASWLNSDGKLFVHIFCHRQYAYLFETEGEENWMGKNFFTGGIMPSEDLFFHFQDDLLIENHWRICGIHYQKTCEMWLDNMDQNRKSILTIFESTYGKEQACRWFQRWRVFFMACAELFGHNNGNEWFVSHYLFRKR